MCSNNNVIQSISLSLNLTSVLFSINISPLRNGGMPPICNLLDTHIEILERVMARR